MYDQLRKVPGWRSELREVELLLRRNIHRSLVHRLRDFENVVVGWMGTK